MFFIVFVKKLTATARIFVLNWKVHLLVISSAQKQKLQILQLTGVTKCKIIDLKVVFEKVVMVLLRFLHSSV